MGTYLYKLAEGVNNWMIVGLWAHSQCFYWINSSNMNQFVNTFEAFRTCYMTCGSAHLACSLHERYHSFFDWGVWISPRWTMSIPGKYIVQTPLGVDNCLTISHPRLSLKPFLCMPHKVVYLIYYYFFVKTCDCQWSSPWRRVASSSEDDNQPNFTSIPYANSSLLFSRDGLNYCWLQSDREFCAAPNSMMNTRYVATVRQRALQKKQ